MPALFRRVPRLLLAVFAYASTTAATEAVQDFSTLYSFSVFAGTLSSGSTDGPLADARFNRPYAVTRDNAGNLYVVEANNTVRKITPNGIVTTLAGLAQAFGSTDGTGIAARFANPQGIAVGSTGDLFVVDTGNHIIRKITPAGVVSTFAGQPGFSGSTDGTGAAARFWFPTGISVGSNGDLFVTDSRNHTIRKITTAGVVSTFAGQAGAFGSADGSGTSARFAQPQAIAADAAGNLYVADSYNYTIRRISSAGEVSTLAGSAGSFGSVDGSGAEARFRFPRGVALDQAGNVYVTDDDYTVRKITSTGVVTRLAGRANTYGADDGTGEAATFWQPLGLVADPAGNLYVADSANNLIRKVTPAGIVTTAAGLADAKTAGYVDGAGTSARFRNPVGLVTDDAGNVFVADADNHVIRKITPAGVVSTFAGSADVAGTVDGTGTAARFGRPSAMAKDNAGALYVADWDNAVVRKISSTGSVSTAFTGIPTTDGIALDASGNLYVVDSLHSLVLKAVPGGAATLFAGGGNGAYNSVNGDGRGPEAYFSYPIGITIDSAGRLFVTDAGQSTIRRITADATVSTFAGSWQGWDDGPANTAQFSYPMGITTDSNGNLYVSSGSGVRKITPGGQVSTPAGLPMDNNQDVALIVQIVPYTWGIAIDAQGSLYVTHGNAILKGQRAAAPVVATQPQNQSVTAGGSVQFSVTASGAPAPLYQWYFNGSPFEGATTSTLSISNARSSDAGNYSVTVTNALGSVTSNTATLTLTTSSGSGGGIGGGSGGGKGGGGGGAPSVGFLITLLALAGIRRLAGKTQTHA